MRVLSVPVDLPAATQDTLLLMATTGMPFEVCGVIYNNGSILQYENLCEEPEHGFDAYIDFTSDIDVIWHSHPNGLMWPSRQDMPTMNAAANDGLDYRWLIINPNELALHMYVMRRDATSSAA